jgi:arylsulfatase A-like enzyme
MDCKMSRSNREKFKIRATIMNRREFLKDKNTIVMFSSENGPHKEGGADSNFFKSFGPLRDYKRDLYEGGIRVPFITR